MNDRIAEGRRLITVDGVAAGLAVEAAALTLKNDVESAASVTSSLSANSVSPYPRLSASRKWRSRPNSTGLPDRNPLR